MRFAAVPICYDGSPVRLLARRSFRAGPLTFEYEGGELRYVRLGDREVIRRIYVAVRDHDWGTVPGLIVRESFEAGPDCASIHFEMAHRGGEVDFEWHGWIVGAADGTVRFQMEGEAKATFRRNRIGCCVLHPIRECAGAKCRYELGDGTTGASSFPRSVAPHNPFHELRRLGHEVEPGLWAELEFEGDLFETEDQRNWIDASFKTYCTPLRLPFPVTVEAGARVSQTVTLRLVGASTPTSTSRSTAAPWISLGRKPIGTIPEIGLGMATGVDGLSPREVDRLRVLRPSHIRVELSLADTGSIDVLRRATEQACAIGCGLDVALVGSERVDAALAGFVARLGVLRPPVRRLFVFDESGWGASEDWVRLARSRLREYDPSIPLFSGTRANFLELNRSRPPIELLDGVCYSAQPQEHADDNTSLVETCAALWDTLQTAREFSGTLPLAVTPITLRKRVNPYATGPTKPDSPGVLPSRVDPRQMSLLGAGWTLGSLKSLAEGGAAVTTWYETVGWLGVMEGEAGCPLPDLFPSQPGMVFPLFHVLADAAEYPGASVVDAPSSEPLTVTALALLSPESIRVMVANLAGVTTTVTVTGLGSEARVRLLDETTFDHATMRPESFRADRGRPHETAAGRLELTLKPYAYATIHTP